MDAKSYYGYLFDRQGEVAPSDTLDALLRALGQHIISSIGDKFEHALTPNKLAAFYKEVGGDYDALFLELPCQSLSFVYQVTGCQHTLIQGPGDSDFKEPSVPALTLKGFVRWVSIETLLSPEEHVPYLQYAVRNFGLKHPESGQLFPPDLPAECFPKETDPEMDKWHKECADKLRSVASRADISLRAVGNWSASRDYSRPSSPYRKERAALGLFRESIRSPYPRDIRTEVTSNSSSPENWTSHATASSPRTTRHSTCRTTSRDRSQRRTRSRSRSAVRNQLHDDTYSRPFRHRSYSLSDITTVAASATPGLDSDAHSRTTSRAAESARCGSESGAQDHGKPVNDDAPAPPTSAPPGHEGSPDVEGSPEPTPSQTIRVPSRSSKALTHLTSLLRYLSSSAANFLGHQTTAWFILVCATAGSAILTSLSVQKPPSCLPDKGDMGYYASFSQALISLCSLYYLVVPLVRSGYVPVRMLFYVSWVAAAGTSITVPLVYLDRRWQYASWFTFASGVAQVAATAFLFENIDSGGKTTVAGGSPGKPTGTQAVDDEEYELQDTTPRTVESPVAA